MLRKSIVFFIFCLIYDGSSNNYPQQFITFDCNYANSNAEFNYFKFYDDDNFSNIFTSGIGSATNLKLSYNYLINNNLYLGASFILNNNHTQYSLLTREIIGVNGELLYGTFSKSMLAESQNIFVSIYLEKFMFSNFMIKIGAEINMLNQNNFSFSERIIYPIDEGVFLDNFKRIRNKRTNDLENLNSLSIFTEIKYLFPVNNMRNFFIFPQLSYHLNIYSEDFIKPRMENIGFGLGVSYFFNDYLNTLPNEAIEEIPVDFEAMITLTGIENGIEHYVDSVAIQYSLNSSQLMCNLSTLNFNIIASNRDVMKSWKLIIFTEQNEFHKEISGVKSIPSYISWDIYRDMEFKKLLKTFSSLDSSNPRKFSLDLNYQLIITSKTDFIYTSDIKSINLFLKSE